MPFELRQNAKTLSIPLEILQIETLQVIEAFENIWILVKPSSYRLLTGMTERRISNVVCKTRRL
jgi:hypothetical protein